MKWIGQHIWDLISRFRSDVYLDSPTAGGSDPDKFLGIDSDNKIIYRTGAEVFSDIGAAAGDITGVDLTGTSPINIGSETGTTSGDYSATISVDGASTTGRGVVELATTAETTTGTDTIRAVTPDGLKDGYQGSTNVNTLGTIGIGTWRGTNIELAQGGTGLVGATDGKIIIADGSGEPVHLDVGSSTGITTLGTIATGVWEGTAIATAYIADDAVTFAKASGVSPKVFGSIIKILPSDFMSNDDGGATKFGIGFVETDSTSFGMKIPNANTELLAFVSIPEGMKATHVDIFDDGDDRVVEVFEANVNSRTITSKGSGNCNTTLDMTDVNATATNYLLILITTTATSDRTYGGYITIAAQ